MLAPNDGTLLDGVMLGRSLYHVPYMLANVDHLFFADVAQKPARIDVVKKDVEYADRVIRDGARAHNIFRHLVGLYSGCGGARLWRQTITRVGQSGDNPNDLTKLARTLENHESIAA